MYKRIEFSKKKSYYSIKHQKKDLQVFAIEWAKKIPYPRNAKEYYQLFISKKNTKLVKQWKIITQQLNTFENPNGFDINQLL